MVPLFVVSHLVTGIVREVRQMVPLAFVIIPAAMLWLFPGSAEGEGAHAELAVSGPGPLHR
jgi:hypothetical protein